MFAEPAEDYQVAAEEAKLRSTATRSLQLHFCLVLLVLLVGSEAANERILI